MGANSKIEWTHHTFNPVWGCAKVSPGCDNCYAERDSKRFGTPWGVDAPRRTFGDKHWDEPLRWDLAAFRSGERRRVFCASMADVFDKNWPAGTRERLWDLIAKTPNLDWLLLTKRIGNARGMLPIAWTQSGAGMPPNVWLGISVVNQDEADRDIPKLMDAPAHVRFLSCEPLLGPIVLRPEWTDIYVERYRLSWVIVGGESGPRARGFHPNWARSLRDQCNRAGVPFHFKQWGEWIAVEAIVDAREGDVALDGLDGVYRRVGKKAAGRMLDGRTWDEFPRSAA